MTSQQELRKRTLASRRQTQLRQRTQQQAQRASQPSQQQRSLQLYVQKINSGEITDLNQIPIELRGKLNVTQSQLNQIQKEVTVKKEIARQKKEREEALKKYKTQRTNAQTELKALQQELQFQQTKNKGGKFVGLKARIRDVAAGIDKLKTKISITGASKTIAEANKRLANYEVAQREAYVASVSGEGKKRVAYEKKLKELSPNVANITSLRGELQREAIARAAPPIKKITKQSIGATYLDPRKETQLVKPSAWKPEERAMRVEYATRKTKESLGKIRDKLIDKEKFKSDFKWVEDRVHLDLKGGTTSGKLGISFGLKDEATIPEKVIDTGISKIEQKETKVEKTTIGSGNISKLDRELEEKYQKEYQASFERKHKADIQSGKYSYEVAAGAYAVSDEAKRVQSKYQKEYETKYKQLQVDAGKTGAGIWGGVKQTGLSLAKTGLQVARSPVKTVAVGGALYAGGAVLGASPTISYGATSYFGVQGASKFVNPNLTYAERGGGLVMAAGSAISLGGAAFKYAKGGITRQVKIKAPRQNIKTNVRYYEKTGRVVKYPSQKVGQYSQAGRRVEVTTRWRAWSNRNLDTKFQPIYKGVPSAAPAKYINVKGFRGTTKVKVGKSGYDKASLALKRSGYTPAQIKSQLRYTAPRVTEQYFSGRLIVSKGGKKAAGEFGYITKRKVMTVDKDLGIKTRGGGTSYEYTRVGRVGKDTKKGLGISKEQSIKSTFGVTQKKVVDLKSVEFKGGVNVVKSSKSQGWVPDRFGKVRTYQKGEVTRLNSAGIESPMGLKFTKKGTTLSYDTRVIKGSTTQAIGVNRIPKGTEIKGLVKPAKIVKTPLSRTFKPEPTVTFTKIPKTSPSTSGTGLQTVTKTKPEAYLSAGTKSRYSGMGMYERTESTGRLITAPQAPAIRSTSLGSTTPSMLSRTGGFNLGTSVGVGVLSLGKPKIKQKETLGLKEVQLGKAVVIQTPSLIQGASTTTSTIQGITTKPAVTTTTTTTTITAPTTSTSTSTITPRPTTRPPIPRPKIPIPLKLGTPKKAKAKKKKVSPMKLDVFVRRRGSDKRIGTFGTEREAKKALRKRLAGTLAASGFIERDRKKQKVNLGFAYTTSKKDKLRVVQKREFRLGTKGETLEIGMFKKKKGKKKKKKGGFF